MLLDDAQTKRARKAVNRAASESTLHTLLLGEDWDGSLELVATSDSVERSSSMTGKRPAGAAQLEALHRELAANIPAASEAELSATFGKPAR